MTRSSKRCPFEIAPTISNSGPGVFFAFSHRRPSYAPPSISDTRRYWWLRRLRTFSFHDRGVQTHHIPVQTHTTARQFTLRINHSSTSFCPACRDFSWRNYDNHLQAQVSPHSVSLHNKINVKKGAIHHIARHFCLQTTATATPASYISSSNDSSLPSLSTLASFTKGPLILLVRFLHTTCGSHKHTI